jgi:hypothetical protein
MLPFSLQNLLLSSLQSNENVVPLPSPALAASSRPLADAFLLMPVPFGIKP